LDGDDGTSAVRVIDAPPTCRPVHVARNLRAIAASTPSRRIAGLGALVPDEGLGTQLVVTEFAFLWGEKTTKTDAVKHVPVHPTLAAMFAEWKLGGSPLHEVSSSRGECCEACPLMWVEGFDPAGACLCDGIPPKA